MLPGFVFIFSLIYSGSYTQEGIRSGVDAVAVLLPNPTNRVPQSAAVAASQGSVFVRLSAQRLPLTLHTTTPLHPLPRYIYIYLPVHKTLEDFSCTLFPANVYVNYPPRFYQPQLLPSTIRRRLTDVPNPAAGIATAVCKLRLQLYSDLSVSSSSSW